MFVHGLLLSSHFLFLSCSIRPQFNVPPSLSHTHKNKNKTKHTHARSQVMQRAMYVLAQGLAAEPDPPTSYDDDDPPGTWKATHSPWIGRRVTRRASNLNQDNGQGDDLGVVSC